MGVRIKKARQLMNFTWRHKTWVITYRWTGLGFFTVIFVILLPKVFPAETCSALPDEGEEALSVIFSC